MLSRQPRHCLRLRDRDAGASADLLQRAPQFLLDPRRRTDQRPEPGDVEQHLRLADHHHARRKIARHRQQRRTIAASQTPK